jgi:hypothetical protein
VLVETLALNELQHYARAASDCCFRSGQTLRLAADNAWNERRRPRFRSRCRQPGRPRCLHAGAQAMGMLRFDQKRKRAERDAPAENHDRAGAARRLLVGESTSAAADMDPDDPCRQYDRLDPRRRAAGPHDHVCGSESRRHPRSARRRTNPSSRNTVFVTAAPPGEGVQAATGRACPASIPVPRRLARRGRR